MKDKTKVLHVLGSLDFGGAELRTIEIAERLCESERFQFEFLALSGNRGPLEDRCASSGFTVHHLKRSPMFPRKLVRILRERKVDIVHSHVHLFSGVVLWLSSIGGVPGRIAHFRSVGDGRRNNLMRMAYRLLMKKMILRYSTSVVAVSKSVMSGVWPRESASDSRFAIVPNGLDSEVFKGTREITVTRLELGLDAQEALVLHVGNFRRAKNQRRLLRIFNRLQARGTRAKLVLIGDGLNGLHDVVSSNSESGLPQCILIEGQLPRDRVADRIAAADLLVFPSLWEGLPGAVLEACACGLPVLASDIPPHREIAEHFDGVSLMALDDSDDAWASKIQQILSRDRVRDLPRFLHDFSRSPYDLESASFSFRDLWSSQALSDTL